MKLLFPVFCLFLPALLPAQTNAPSLPPSDTITDHWYAQDKKQPTEKDVLLKITVYNLARNKMANVDVRLLQTATGKVWRGPTGSYGDVLFLVPKGMEYRIDAGNETGIQTLRVSSESYARESVGLTYLPDRFREEERNDSIFQHVSPAQTPTRSRVLVILTILDLDNRPLEDEAMFFAAKKSGKVYTAATNRGGKAYLMLPMGDTYCFSMRFEANLKCYEFPAGDRPGELSISYNTIGTKEILRRRAERKRQAAIQDSLYRVQRVLDSITMVRRDSLYRAMSVRDSVVAARRALLAEKQEEHFLHQLQFGQRNAEVEQRIERRAATEREAVAHDPKYFEKSGEAVKATLYRMRERWKNKVIVTDLTGSMSPYMDQVVLWHALQLVQGEENRYVFFNDGDAKADGDKIIGQTGGIYFTENAGMNQLLNTMATATHAGYGGDSPENDLEALIYGMQKRSGLDELILIADNYSDVRDMPLLARLHVPVHIILCGTDAGVNEDYLEIAYKTGGTIHTIEQDIEDLAKLADGATIEIGGFRYRVSRGKFIQVSRI